MSETLDRPQTEKEKAERELEHTQHKIWRLKNHRQYYKKGERRARDFKTGIKDFVIEASKETLCEVLNLIPFTGIAKIAINSLCRVIQKP